LQAENVQYVWGYPGGAVLYIYDALYKQDTISTCWCVTNRRPCMLPTVMRAPPATSAWRWSMKSRSKARSGPKVVAIPVAPAVNAPINVFNLQLEPLSRLAQEFVTVLESLGT